MGHLVICNAEVSGADGNTRLLHQPLGQGYWLLVPAADGISVDVVIPPVRPSVCPRSPRLPRVALPPPRWPGCAVSCVPPDMPHPRLAMRPLCRPIFHFYLITSVSGAYTSLRAARGLGQRTAPHPCAW